MSANWAGYAVHGFRDHFRQVSGFWNEPKLVCRSGQKSYVAIWAGLGGFSPSSIATEQIGTEGDCHTDGQQVSYAWYQLQPGARKSVAMTIKPGDAMQAIVTLGRGTVTLELANHTHPQLYAQTFTDTTVDDSAADWMVEAVPFCISANACQPMRLANFRFIRFGLATTRLSTGYVGAISDPKWQATAVSMGLQGRRYSVRRDASTAAAKVGGASPSALTPDGAGFTVRYRSLTVGGNPFL